MTSRYHNRSFVRFPLASPHVRQSSKRVSFGEITQFEFDSYAHYTIRSLSVLAGGEQQVRARVQQFCGGGGGGGSSGGSGGGSGGSGEHGDQVSGQHRGQPVAGEAGVLWIQHGKSGELCARSGVST